MPETSPAQPTELTREQLYERVWQTPMSRLADEFGVSGNGLAKICRRLDVPYPPRGWWAKKAAGKSTSVAPLPAADRGYPTTVAIRPSAPSDATVTSRIAELAETLDILAVPLRLARPHPLIAKWISQHEQRLAEAKSERDPWMRRAYGVREYSATDRREHRFLHALFISLEHHGASISQDDHGHLFAKLNGEKMEFSMYEKSRQVTRPLTEQEKRWETWNTSGVKKDLEPTGLFHFSIKRWLDQPFRKTWMESPQRPIEGMLSTIVATFVVMSEILAEQTQARQKEALEFAERQRLSQLQRDRLQQDTNRWERFLDIAEQWRRVDIARQFLARFDQSPMENEGDETRRQWIRWAYDHLNANDPLLRGADAIFEEISAVTATDLPRARWS